MFKKKKITEHDIEILLITQKLDSVKMELVKKLVKRKNKPLTVSISEIYSIMDEYAPSIIGHSIENEVFVCRRMQDECVLFLQPYFWASLKVVRKKFHCICPQSANPAY